MLGGQEDLAILAIAYLTLLFSLCVPRSGPRRHGHLGAATTPHACKAA